MNTTERIKHATSPQDAMMILAHALDSIHAEIQGIKNSPMVTIEPGLGDPWGAWEVGVEGESFEAVGFRNIAKTTADGAYHRKLESDLEQLREDATKADGEDRQAIEAKIRLLEDRLNAKPVDYGDDEGQRTVIEAGEDGDTLVVLPPVLDEWKEQRRTFAETIGLEGEFVEHYVKGGPLWLYYGDREYVMGLPPDWRRSMVLDVEAHSPAEAHEFSRDVLKDASPGTYDYAEKVLG